MRIQSPEVMKIELNEDMTDEQIVKLVYPDSKIVGDDSCIAYHRYSVLTRPGIINRIGGGPTVPEAWRNARIHLGVYRD